MGRDASKRGSEVGGMLSVTFGTPHMRTVLVLTGVECAHYSRSMKYVARSPPLLQVKDRDCIVLCQAKKTTTNNGASKNLWEFA